LSCKPLSNAKFQEISEDYHNGIPICNQHGLKDIQMHVGAQTALTKLHERDEDLADFLRHLDMKINTVLQKVMGEKTLFDELEIMKASLSGTGIAFSSDKPFIPDEKLEIHIVLLPDYIYVYSIGKTISCEEQQQEEEGGKKFKIAVEFVVLMESDREKLIQHNFKQQSLALRNRRCEQ
jgi:hypothetical protein